MLNYWAEMETDIGLLVEIGERLRRVRMMAGLTRDMLALQSGVSKTSISYWENATLKHPIKPRSLQKLMDVFRQNGVACDERWILMGIGGQPSVRLATDEKSVLNQHFAGLDAEIEFFRELSPDAVVTKIPHHFLFPLYHKNDFVGGIWESNFEFVKEECAIIEVEDMLDIKIIKKIKNNLFETFYLDQQQSQTLTLARFAPLIRLWRA